MNMQPESHAAQGKDEFGRDIRSSSPEQDRDEPPVPSRPPHAPEPLGVPEPAAPPPSAESRVTGLPAPHMAAAPAAAVTPAAPPVLTTGLEALDFSSLDFSAPAAWETLGQAWKITHGVAPTQEQLMQFIMSGGQVQAPASNDVGPAAVAQSASGGGGYAGQDDAYMNWGYQGRGSGPGRGRGGGRPRETRGPYTGGGDSVDEYTIPVFESGGNR
jgi:protein NRD1